MTEKGFLSNLVIQIDTREPVHAAYRFDGYLTVREKLDVGDYALLHAPECCIERKTLDDLVGSLTKGRERLEKEFQRGANLRYFALVIEASLSDLANGTYRSQVVPASVIQTLLSWSVKYRVPIFFAESREFAEKITLSLLLKYARIFYQKYNLLSKRER